MPIVPNLPERLLFFRLNRAPGPVLDIFGAVAFRAVLAAVNLGVFEGLRGGPLSAADLAGRIGADERGVVALLDALGSLGYVSGRDGLYSNTSMTNRWLVRESPESVAAGFDYWGTILRELWGDLEGSIRDGAPRTNLYGWVEAHPEASRDFQEWMVATSRLLGDEISRKLKLPSQARRLLDVGGGHGAYSIALCRRHPQLTATVFDLPEALKAARENVAAEGLEDRIELREGDFLTQGLPTGYDVALLFNIVHGFEAEQNAALLQNVAVALGPGGLVALVEQVTGKAPSPTSRAFAQLLGLSYFHLLGGRIFSFEEIAGWLTAAGFENPRKINLLRAPGNTLILGTKASR